MDLTSVILVSVAFVVVLFMTYGIKKLKTMKPIDYIKYLDDSKKIFDLVDQATHSYIRVDPEKEKVVELIVKYAKIAVDSVEQMCIAGNLPKALRKDKAKDIVKLSLANAGVSLSVGQDVLIDHVIEAMVFLLPESKQ